MEGLNNVIAIINSEFGFSHAESFDKNEYSSIMQASELKIDSLHASLNSYVDHVRINLPQRVEFEGKKDELFDLYNDPLQKIKEYFISEDVVIREFQEEIETHGLWIKERKTTNDPAEQSLSIYLDFMLIENNLGHVKEILKQVYNKKMSQYHMRIRFRKDLHVITEGFKISSALFNSDVSLSDVGGGTFQFKNVLFAIDNLSDSSVYKKDESGIWLRIIFEIDEIQEMPLDELIRLLLDRNVVSEPKS